MNYKSNGFVFDARWKC